MSDFSSEVIAGYGQNQEVILKQAPQNARFYPRMVPWPYESQQQGKPVLRQADYIEINTAGERDVIDREATDFDKARHRALWQAYLEKRELPPEGTLLMVLFPAQPEIVDHLANLKCRTVEQLAELSDTGVQHIGMGALEWRDIARKFLASTKDSSRFHQIEAKQAEQDFKIKEMSELNTVLRKENDALIAQLDAATSPRARRA